MEHLYWKLLYPDAKERDSRKRIDDVWEVDFQPIKRFRMIRSLTIAHPLETVRYPDFGAGKNDGVCCEDVRPRNPMRDDDGDYVLVMLKPGIWFGKRLSVSVEDDFIMPAKCAFDALGRLGEAVCRKSQAKIAELSKTPLRAHAEMSLPDYLDALKKDLEDRYPSKVERINYEDGFDRRHSIIGKAEQLLNVSFSDEIVRTAYEGYRNFVTGAVFEFADSLQKMRLEEGRSCPDGAGTAHDAEDKLASAAYPSCSKLVSPCNLDDALYRFDKIFNGLDSTAGRSIESARQKLACLGGSGCAQVNACSDAEWGII